MAQMGGAFMTQLGGALIAQKKLEASQLYKSFPHAAVADLASHLTFQ